MSLRDPLSVPKGAKGIFRPPPPLSPRLAGERTRKRSVEGKFDKTNPGFFPGQPCAEARVQGNRWSPAALESRFRANDE